MASSIEDFQHFILEQLKKQARLQKLLVLGSLVTVIGVSIWFAVDPNPNAVILPSVLAGGLLMFPFWIRGWIRMRNPRKIPVFQTIFEHPDKIKFVNIVKAYKTYTFSFKTDRFWPVQISINGKENAELMLSYVKQFLPNVEIRSGKQNRS